jgi:Aromatic acid exporter family member 1
VPRRDDLVRRLRERGPASFARAVRLSVAAVASYAIALGVLADRRPVTAALTALLIVQVTLFGTIADTARRILSVVVGVGAAITVSAFVGFTWWSLLALVLGSIMLGQALRLGPHLLEVPISAMLILAAGGAGLQAIDRVAETFIGAFVGLLLNVVVPPSTRTRTAGEAVEAFAARMAELIERVGRTLAERPVSRDQALDWLREQRQLAGDVAHVDRVLAETQRSRRFNPRAAGSWDPVPDLRQGLDALEHTAVALRLVLRALADGVGATISHSDDGEQGAREAKLRRRTAAVLHDLARCIARYGTLVRTGAATDATRDDLHDSLDELRTALDDLRASESRLAEMLVVDPREAGTQWHRHGSLLSGLDRVIEELDLDTYASARERRRREAAESRRPATVAAQRLRSSARRVAEEHPVVRRRRLR